MATLTLLKFSSHDCEACQSMTAIDSKVTAELGLNFIDVDLRNADIYKRYRGILLRQHPLKSGLLIPCYLLVGDPEGEAITYGELVGAMPEGEFRSQLEALIQAASAPTAGAALPGPSD